MPVATPWVRPLAARPNARLRLICFHPAGGGPSLFRDWPAALPADIEVLAVHLPGRETRVGEPCLTHYQEAVAQLHTALRPFLDREYALFGHSMGALLAYGVAMAAARHGDPAPARLLVSGAAGPGSTPAKPGRGEWTDAELVQELRDMGGTPEEVLADRALLDLILPPLRADYALCDSFHGSFTEPAGPPLDCPVSVLGGADDDVSPADLQRWSTFTSADSSLRLFPGGHFFLLAPSADAVLTAVTADLTVRASA
ncbi:thioesterase II family protein [Streptomyces sp. NPDC002513]